MTVAFAVFLFIHGLAHVVGFLTVSGLVTDESRKGGPFLIGPLEQGSAVAWLFAVVWMLVGLMFVLAGVGLLVDTAAALPLLFAATAVSTVLSLLWVRQAPIGVVANAVVIVVLAVPWLSERALP